MAPTETFRSSPSEEISEPPVFSLDEARQIAQELYGFDASARQLPSYYDQNFLLEDPSGSRRVLKITNARVEAGSVDLQNHAMQRAAVASEQFAVPVVYPTLDSDQSTGVHLTTVPGRGEAHHRVRLLSYVEGTPWSAEVPRGSALRRDLGRVAAELGRAMEGFTHPAMDRFCTWDLKHSHRVREYVGAIESPMRRAMVERLLDHFEVSVAPRLEGLRSSVVHGDINNDNVMVDGDRVVGLIDFGDVVYSKTVFEIAITMAYAMLGAEDPLAAGRDVLEGYQAVWPLEPGELDLVFDLARTRLAASVTFSAHFGRLDPVNTYVSANEKAAWRVLEELEQRSAEQASASHH